jgi:hypothetical protein
LKKIVLGCPSECSLSLLWLRSHCWPFLSSSLHSMSETTWFQRQPFTEAWHIYFKCCFFKIVIIESCVPWVIGVLYMLFRPILNYLFMQWLVTRVLVMDLPCFQATLTWGHIEEEVSWLEKCNSTKRHCCKDIFLFSLQTATAAF